MQDASKPTDKARKATAPASTSAFAALALPQRAPLSTRAVQSRAGPPARARAKPSQANPAAVIAVERPPEVAAASSGRRNSHDGSVSVRPPPPAPARRSRQAQLSREQVKAALMQQHSMAAMAKGPVMPRIEPGAVQLKKGTRRSSIGGAPSELSAMQAEIAAAEAAAQREREAKEAAERAQRAADRALSSAPAPADAKPAARDALPAAPTRPTPASGSSGAGSGSGSGAGTVVVGNTIRRGKKDEKHCNSCKKEFGLLRSKNKCAACGSHFCSKCIRKAVLSKFDKKAMEVCGNCYAQHVQQK